MARGAGRGGTRGKARRGKGRRSRVQTREDARSKGGRDGRTAMGEMRSQAEADGARTSGLRWREDGGFQAECHATKPDMSWVNQDFVW